MIKIVKFCTSDLACDVGNVCWQILFRHVDIKVSFLWGMKMDIKVLKLMNGWQTWLHQFMKIGSVRGAWTRQNLLGKAPLWCRHQCFCWLHCKFVHLHMLWFALHDVRALEYTHKCICIYLWSGISVVKASVFVRYDGSIGLASRAMASVDQLVSQLNR